jgi:beta-lactamase class A
MKLFSPKAVLFAQAVFLLLVGAVLGFYFDRVYVHEFCESKYDFVNSDLLCSGRGEIISKVQYTDLRFRLEQYFENKKNEGALTDVAVYFRDLHQGPVMGIRETTDFAPASLLKLPLAMMYELEEEKNEGYIESIPALGYASLNQTDQTSGGVSAMNLNQAYPPPNEISPNQRYEVSDLIFRMLAYSDNKAFALLAEHMINTKGAEEFERVYKDLGLISLNQTDADFISVRGYASLFRLLYNASYVNAEYSEKLLEYMSQSTFKQGLEAGVPEGVRVSHKFGERGSAQSSELQLHDCGIVYYPENPYVLCVMTKGYDMSELALTIAEISRQVYEEVDSRRK